MALTLGAPSVLLQTPLRSADAPACSSSSHSQPPHRASLCGKQTHLSSSRHRCIVFATSSEPSSVPSKASPPPNKPALTMMKGQIVRVDKEKYLVSVEVGYPHIEMLFFKMEESCIHTRETLLSLTVPPCAQLSIAVELLQCTVLYLAVGHPLNFKGIDYIYEDRGEILDVRIFETGEYALVGWAGIPTSPAWLPTYMLIKSEKLSYKRT